MRALFNVLGRLWRFIIGLMFQGVKTIEAGNPKAVLEAEVDRFNTAQADFNQGLARQAGLVKRLDAQIKKMEADIKGMTGRVTALIKFPEGSTERSKAGQIAATLQQTKAELVENRTQREQAQAMYESLTKQRNAFVKESRAKIDKVKSMIGKADMAEAQAKLAGMASDVQFNPDGSGLSELEASLAERAADAEGKVQVAADAVAASPWAMTAAEQSAGEEAALAEFMTSMEGGDAPATEAPATDTETKVETPAP